MACCGKKRMELRKLNQNTQGPQTIGSQVSQIQSRSNISYQYIGKTGLTVIGTVTGKSYNFDKPGAITEIDPRDRPFLAAVPNLKLVKN